MLTIKQRFFVTCSYPLKKVLSMDFNTLVIRWLSNNVCLNKITISTILEITNKPPNRWRLVVKLASFVIRVNDHDTLLTGAWLTRIVYITVPWNNKDIIKHYSISLNTPGSLNIKRLLNVLSNGYVHCSVVRTWYTILLRASVMPFYIRLYCLSALTLCKSILFLKEQRKQIYCLSPFSCLHWTSK